MPRFNRLNIKADDLWTEMNQRVQIVQKPIKFARVLTLIEVIALAVGGTLGIGAYVLARDVAYTITGPAVISSFVVAAIASAMSATYDAEFAIRIPHSDSDYIYAYATISEFMGFVFGWDLALEYIIGKTRNSFDI